MSCVYTDKKATITLARPGKLLEPLKKYAPAFGASKTLLTGGTDNYGSNAAINIRPYHVLRPIPQQEIDHTGGKIK